MSGPVADPGSRRLALPAVDRLDQTSFVAQFGGVYEGSPWIAERAWAQRPFTTLDGLHTALTRIVDEARTEEQLDLIRAHPDLAGKAAVAGKLTDESTREQASAGLDRLSPEQFARLTALNTEYRERFGFPFVICAREHDADSIIVAAAQRVANDPDTERRMALGEIAKIAWLRLADLVDEGAT